MKNINVGITRFVLGSILALGLTNQITKEEVPQVYAKSIDEEDDLIRFKEDGKFLQMIELTVGDYQELLLGYLYVQDDCVYLENPMKNGLYNLSELDKQYDACVVFCDAMEVLPSEITFGEGITGKQTQEIIDSFKVVEKTITMDDDFNFSYRTFVGPNVDGEHLKMTKVGLFNRDYVMFLSTFDEAELKASKGKQDQEILSLGYYENHDLLPYYNSADQEVPSGFTNDSGVIIKYFAFDRMGKPVASFSTQAEIEEFRNKNIDNLDEYTWKAALYIGSNVDQILDEIMNNQIVSSEYTTYFIDYEIKSKNQQYTKRFE